MRFLLFMDWLRENAPWIVIAAAALASLTLMRSPKITNRWMVKVARLIGVGLICLTTLAAALLAVGDLIFSDPPSQHFEAVSPDGSKFALLSHSELRDSAVHVVEMEF
ncbi:MAG TPA: hypothetical protein VND90_14835 [Terracidiphilus sp.]|nr:hypothetical protein [Terracidiphilus sp.]